MNERLTKWAAVAVLSIGAAAPALGGSVTRPGDTIGLAVGVPLPEGFHLGNTTTEQCTDTSPQRDVFPRRCPHHNLDHAMDDFWRTTAR